MSVHKIKKGLDLPILGEPDPTLETARQPSRVALVASDYHGLKPTMHAEVGDTVRRGQLLMEDKKIPGLRFTAPGGGKVVAVHRGAKRALQSVVIELDDRERAGSGETVSFESFTGKHPSELEAAQVEALLVESGLWTALRARPYDKVAAPGTRPRSIFVTACDSSPLAPPIGPVIAGRESDFQRGLVALSQLRDPEGGGKLYVCTDANTELPIPGGDQFSLERFAGPHPSGTAGLHIHTLDPVDRKKLVWHVGYQDVLAIGRLFQDGNLDMRRVISLAGPEVRNPRLLETRLGASTDELVDGGLKSEKVRVISGSVLAGTAASGEVHGYLGRYSNQISVIEADDDRVFLGWMEPGSEKFSILPAFVSKLMPGKKFALTTSKNGSHRAIVPLGMYEEIFPFDMLPSYLLRALVSGDVEQAEALGVLELSEEDIALCSFVCPGKYEYGVHLRDILTIIEKEG